jgi:hypothetical protein
MLKRMHSNDIRKKFAVSEVIGTVLLLGISITLFSVVYIALFSIQPNSPLPSSNIIGSVEKNKIIFEHRSGEPLPLNTKILLNIGGNNIQLTVGQILQDSNCDGFWDIGEKLVYNGNDLESLQTEATIVDVVSNSIIMQGVLKEGVTIENPYVITKPAIVFGSHSIQLSMNYNFKNYSGYLRFLYKKSDSDWILIGQSPISSSWGIYDYTITTLIPNTLYYYKAQLEYDSKIIEGLQLPILTLGTIVGEWHLNSGNGIIAIDSSGHNNDGTLYNKPQWTTDAINGSYALSFDGIDDYVLINDNNSLDLVNNLSIEAWIKPLGHSNGFFGDISNQPIDISDFGLLDCLENDFIKVYNNIYAIVCRGTNNKGFLLTVEIGIDGQINNKIIDKLEFDSTLCYDPNIIKINNSNFYIIAYTGPSNDGFLKTVEITNSGLITDSVIDVLEFDTDNCGDPNIIPISGFVYAIAYTGFNNNGYLKTIEIINDGQINNVINTSIFDMTSTQAYASQEFEIINLNGNNYVICYRNKDSDGELRTVRIENDGTIISSYHNYPEGYYINTFLFDRDDGWTPNIVHIYDNIFAAVYGGFESPLTDGWLKTVKISNDGNSFEIIDNLEFDQYFSIETDIIQMNGNIYAIVYRGTDNDGFLNTVEISTDGQIKDSVIDFFEFDTSDCYQPRILNVGVNFYAIVYTSINNDGYIKTINIIDNGSINKNIIDDLEIGIFDYRSPNIIHISDKIYALIYRGLYDDGYIRTLEITNNGQVNDNAINIFEFEKLDCFDPNIIHISGSIYAIVYRGTDNDGFLKTVEIISDGQIKDSVIDFLEFDTFDCYQPMIINVASSVYAIVYRGTDNDGFLNTVEITSDGQIKDSVIDFFEFDIDDSYEPNIFKINNNIFAIAYRGISSYGYLKTVKIENNGSISKTVIDTLIFDNVRCYYPEINYMFNDIYAIVYSRTTLGGYLSTVRIDTNGLIYDSVLDLIRFDNINNPISDVYCYEPNIICINDRIVAIAYRGQFDGYLKTLRIGENGDITDQNDDTFLFDTDGYEPNIIQVYNNVYAITCRRSNFDGYVITIEINQTQKVRRVIAKEGAYKIYANSTTVFAYLNNMELKAPISSGFNYIVLTYNKNAGSNNTKLYVNAIEVINCTFSEDITINANNLYFGDFNCVVDEIFIHEVEISKNEITQRYNDFIT